MIKKMSVLVLIVIGCLTGTIVADSEEGVPLKVKTSATNLFILGDANIGVEKYYGKTLSMISTIHYIPNYKDESNEDTYLFKHPDYRVTFGVRAYFPNWSKVQPETGFGKFFSLDMGLNGVDDKIIPSMELWVGNSKKISPVIYSEFAFGIGRLFEKNSLGDVSPLVSLSLGYLF